MVIRRLGLDPAQGVGDILAGPAPSAAGQLGVPADRGQRGAQLMARVGDELAYPFLARVSDREGVVDVAEHPVERGAHLPDLGARIGVRVGDPYERSTSPFARGSSATRCAVAATLLSGRSEPRTMNGTSDRGQTSAGAGDRLSISTSRQTVSCAGPAVGRSPA